MGLLNLALLVGGRRADRRGHRPGAGAVPALHGAQGPGREHRALRGVARRRAERLDDRRLGRDAGAPPPGPDRRPGSRSRASSSSSSGSSSARRRAAAVRRVGAGREPASRSLGRRRPRRGAGRRHARRLGAPDRARLDRAAHVAAVAATPAGTRRRTRRRSRRSSRPPARRPPARTRPRRPAARRTPRRPASPNVTTTSRPRPCATSRSARHPGVVRRHPASRRTRRRRSRIVAANRSGV